MNAPTIKHPAAFGAPYEGGFYGGLVRIRDAVHAVVWAPKAQGELTERLAWSDNDEDHVPGATSCFDSETNTRAMAEAGSVLAKRVLELDIDGIRGWVLPARDVLELAYRHLKPGTRETAGYFRDGDNPSSVPAGYPYSLEEIKQTEVTDFRAGGAQAFEETWYWSSTQSSEGNAWLQYFGSGYQYDGDKSFQARARAVRLIQLNA